MNFDAGLVGEFTVDIMQHIVKNEKVSENLKKRYENGRRQRQKIDSNRRLTGGVLFDANHILLDSEVLKLRESKEKEKNDEKERQIRNVIIKFNKMRETYKCCQLLLET